MDSTSTVHSSERPSGTNSGGRKGGVTSNRRGSNPLNNLGGSTGNESGITSPRGEATEPSSNIPATAVAQGKRRPSVSTAPPRPTRPTNSANTPTTSTKNVSLFAHLPQVSTNTTAPTASITAQLLKSGKEASIHPAIIKLGLAFADYSVMGAAERCRQMLLAFKQVQLHKTWIFTYFLQVFRDYQAPADQAISRHLEAHLRPLIAFLIQARPLAISMGHAIRHLKLKISTLPPDTTDSEAREFMIAVIDNYLRNRIDLSDQLIAQHGCTKILPEGDVILVFAHSGVVAKTLIRAHCEDKKRFRVIVVDSRPFLEGRKMLQFLVEAGIDCTYLHLNSIGHVMKEVTKVFLGAHGLFSNGALLSRVGTATIALLAKNANKPVIVCCETLKFSDHLQMDSIVYNEIGDPDTLISSALRHSTNPNGRVLENWRSQSNLKLLNVLYDVTPPEFISLVISEVGLIPVTSIPVVLREYNSSGNNQNNNSNNLY